ncbi:hypothetical protein CACET_c37420 [Clostridium aceticum]|uniref:MetS family NSS transporter small subunit n=1 Tax=Clostridium aceticum TaxID=84022 RepID=A0A0G3WH10_9CLOT|nr:hypothetical protein CACET_c37420 [Clostridium aceticum]
MSTTSIIMMITVLGFYGLGFVFLLAKVFQSKANK